MKCPILVAGYWSSVPGVNTSRTDCLKEECAWYHSKNQACSMLTLAQGSTYVHKVLLAIESKMPPEGQFRK